jgi:hypothetical protein
MVSPFLLACALVCGCYSEDSKANEALAKTAMLGSQNNIERFHRYFCKWKLTKGFSKDLGSALSGKYENTRSCIYTLSYDSVAGKKDRYQCLAPKVDVKTGERQGSRIVVSADFLAMTELRKNDESLFLTYGSWNDARYRLSPYWNNRQEGSPLSMGEFYGDSNKSSPYQLFSELQKGKAGISSNGNVIRDGRPLVHASLSRNHSDWVFYFDPQRGYLPYQCESIFVADDLKKKLRHVVRLIEAKEYPGKGWFPTHLISVWLPVREGEPVNISDLRVEELRLDKDVRAEDFEVELHAGMTIIQDWPEDKYASFKLRQSEKVSPDDLSRIGNLIKDAFDVKRAQKDAFPPRMDTAIAHSQFDFTTWGLITGGGILLTGGLIVYRRRQYCV